ncbi:PIP-CTERM sorting domain-containing protein [Methanocaldococcus infernus]
MRYNRVLIFLLFIIFNLHLISGEVYWIHPNTMNITNSTGGTEFKVNSTINFTAKAFDSFSNSVLVNGSIKWDFGDLTETEYGKEIKITHKYSFPFIYPVAWCGYLNNSGISKAITYNWIVVGDVKNIKYIFNGSPNNQWNVIYNKSKNLTIIKYPFKSKVNYEFKGIRLGSDTVKINYSPSIIVEGDEVQFNFSINRKIIFCLWSFGDGTFSFEESPTHTYNNSGIYFPRVLVVDDEGYVYVGYCEIYVNRPMGGYIYWVTGPYHYGGEAITQVYNSSGEDNDNRGNAYVNPYKITYKPGDNIKFVQSGGWGLYWKWDFGDGTETSYTYHSYFTPAYHEYKFPFMWPFFWVSYGAGSWWKSDTLNFIIVGDVKNTIYNFYPSKTLPKNTYYYSYDKKNHVVNLYYYSNLINKPVKNVKLKFGYYIDIPARVSKSEVNTYELISFNFTPMGKPIFVMWSFGDGEISFESNPTHYYKSPGIYYPHVFVITKEGTIEVGIPPPIGVGGYSSYPQIYVYPTIVRVGDLVTIEIDEPAEYTLYWHHIYFGDGNNVWIRPKTSPYYINYKYNKEGVYPVYMTIPSWGIENEKVVYVINNLNPVAKLFVYPNPAPYTDEITFNPLNSYDPDENRKIPEYNYYGDIIGDYIIPKTSPMARIFGFNITVYDSSGNLVFSYKDSYLHTITHRFEPGNYTAVLTVWDGMGGVSSITKKFEVIDNPPVANFYWVPNIPRVDERVYLYSTSYDPNNDIVNIIWNIENNTYENVTTLLYKFKTPGVHTVTLTVIDRYNKSSSVTKEVTVVGIRANFIYKYINNNTVEFESISAVYPGNITKYIWDFGDGTSEETSNPIITHRYNRSGVYLVTLTIYSNTGLSDRVSKIVYITPSAILYPKADFNYITYNNLTVLFNASLSHSPNGNITKYIWDFGDGTSEETSNPIITHRYNRSGVYLVTLTIVDNKGLSDICTKSVYVHSNESLNVPIPMYIKLLSIVTTIIFILRYNRWIK